MKQFWRVLLTTALCLLVGVSTVFSASYLYVNNNTFVNTVSGFTVNGDGTLTLLPGFPLATGGSGTGNVPAEDAAAKIRVIGSYLYVGNFGSKNISAFQIHSDGSLAAVAGQPFSTGSEGVLLTLALHPSGRFVLCGSSTPGGSPPNDLSVFSIGSDGSLLPVSNSPFAASSPPYSTAFTPDGKFLFEGGNAGTTISVYRFNATSGALSEVSGSPFEGGGDYPVGYSVSPNGQRLFSALYGPDQIGVFDINPLTGTLSAISGSPFATGLAGNPVDSVLDAMGTRLFVVARNATSNIGVYDLASNGVPTPVAESPFRSGGTTAEVVLINNAGRLLFVGNADSQSVSAFVINSQTGVLTAVAGSPFATNAQDGFIGGMALYEQPAPVPAMTGGGLRVFVLLIAGSMFVMLRRKSHCA
jgi:6-phosphogluconolactonase (cycloisomerase 2 family)